ncbi:MAG TPA: ferric reductase-like transmembrane domain-containing protein, partial [Intrasporangium sp.]|nr:ferric reductase-like transmembrane domain-containing protein [Intrasporangium sp.]
MTAVVRGIAWLGIFIGICVAPLVLALMSTSQPGQGFWTDFSVALGFVGLALMGIEFALVARVKTVAEPFGTDAVIDFHRQIGYVGLLFVMIHVALSADWSQANPFAPSNTPARVWFGAAAAAALVVLVASSVWRRRLRLSYEVWQILHAVLAAVAVVAALVHVLLVDYYVDSVWKKVLWSIMTAAFLWLLVWVRVLRPLRIRRRPWTVERVTPERDSTTVLTLLPSGHEGLQFEPGQFAWI